LAQYSEEQNAVTKTGNYGLGNVNGRNAISWQKKFEYDIENIDNLDLNHDCIIIFDDKKSVEN
jgi:undecaprenyl phosphate N,N'-diacetylbacillosamine 1-phosphate transferase